MLQESFYFILKRAFQNMVAMETSRHVDSDISYQFVAS